MRALLVGLALLAGCATQQQQMVWYKPGSTPQTFNMDAGACKAQAFSVPGMPLMQVAIVYNQCMYGRGWDQMPAR
jgi:uncharacterized lipoprotein YajG